MDTLCERVLQRNVIISVIGLGYVGLPMAIALVRAGFTVYGIDINTEHINTLKAGRSYIQGITDEQIAEVIEKKLFVFDTYDEVKNADAILICVPTPLRKSKEPDLSYIQDSMTQILRFIKKDTILVLESTTYPGTTRELVMERICNEKCWFVGKDFYVCYSPERVDPGNQTYSVDNTPKVIGGITSKCLEVGATLYKQFIEQVVPVRTTEVAELSKLLENTFRCVNIALMNEMTIMAERLNIDIWETINAASTKPFGYMTFFPGPGVGGHCIPLDPMYLSWEAKKHNYFSRFIELAMDVNSNMPYYVVRQISELLASQSKALRDSNILLVGMAYKADSNDLRESPALEIYRILKEKSANITFADPYISYFDYEGKKVKARELTKKTIEKQDLIVIVTHHHNIDYELIRRYANIIYDTRNVYSNEDDDKIFHLGERIEEKSVMKETN